MRSVTRTEYIGEWTNTIDWSFNFDREDWKHGGCRNPEFNKRAARDLMEIEERLNRGEEVKVDDGGYGAKRVLWVGMYDGWPYWKPYPSVAVESPLGSIGFERKSYDQVRLIRKEAE